MTSNPALRTAVGGPNALMRLVTIIVVLLVATLGVLAAQHAQTARGETGHLVSTELATAHQASALGPDGGVSESSAEQVAIGLVTGCIVLIVCCALGLALWAARAWRAELSRRLFNATQGLLATFLSVTRDRPGVTARPSLIVLSISRT